MNFSTLLAFLSSLPPQISCAPAAANPRSISTRAEGALIQPKIIFKRHGSRQNSAELDHESASKVNVGASELADGRHDAPPGSSLDKFDFHRYGQGLRDAGRDAAQESSRRQTSIQRAAAERIRLHELEEKPALDAHKKALRDKYASAADRETARREEASQKVAQAQVRDDIQTALKDPMRWQKKKLRWKEYKKRRMRRSRHNFMRERRSLLGQIRMGSRFWQSREFLV